MITTKNISVGKLKIGNALPFILIAGPCVLESFSHTLEIADAIHQVCQRLGIGFVFKASFDKANRTRSDSPRGFSLESALPVFEEIKTRYGCPVLTDVHEPSQCAALADVVDILQIPAFLCRQTDLIVAAAQTGCALNIKKGQFLAPKDMEHVLDKALQAGNRRVFLCERGVSFGYNTLVSDFRALPILAQTGHPVIFDATHSVQQPGGLSGRSGGERQFVETLARAAVAVGVAGLFIETHPDPDHAPSDGPNMVPLSFFGGAFEDTEGYGCFGQRASLSILFFTRDCVRLQDKVVLITGAGRGLGRALAVLFSRAGARVLLVSKTRAHLDETIAEMENPPLRVFQTDLSDDTQIKDLLEGLQKLSFLDILVNNASSPWFENSFQETSQNQMKDFINVSLRAAMVLSQGLLLQLRQGLNPRIINILARMSSVSEESQGHVPPLVYRVAKAGAAAFSEELRVECRSLGIGVLSVYPGAFSKNSLKKDGLHVNHVAESILWAVCVPPPLLIESLVLGVAPV